MRVRTFDSEAVRELVQNNEVERKTVPTLWQETKYESIVETDYQYYRLFWTESQNEGSVYPEQEAPEVVPVMQVVQRREWVDAY